MPIDLSTARPVSPDGVRREAWEGNINLSTAMPKGSTVAESISTDPIFQKLQEARVFKVERKPDVVGQAVRSFGRTALDMTVGTAANWIDGMLDLNRDSVIESARQIKMKRESADYNPSIDIGYLSDNLTLYSAGKMANVELGGKVVKDKNFVDVWQGEFNKFLDKNFAQKKGAVNEWVGAISSGATSIGGSYLSMFGALKVATALKASQSAAAMAPAAWIGAVAGGQAMEQAEEFDAPIDKRLRTALEVGVGEASLEFVGMGYVRNMLRGALPIERVAIGMVNNAAQEGLQGVSSGTIMKIEGVSKEDWITIFKNAGKDAIVGAIVGGPAEILSYRAEQKSLLGDFRGAGLSDNDISMILDEVRALPENMKVNSGDLEKVFLQKGLPETLSKNAEKVVLDYGAKEMMKETVIGKIMTELYKKGLSSQQALAVAEQAADSMANETKKMMMEELLRRTEQLNELDADDQIQTLFMQKYVNAGMFGNMTEDEWISTGIATAQVVSKQAIAEAKRQGVGPVEFYKSKEGYDAVAWTPGEQQAARYDLSKQVEQVLYKKEDGEKYSLNIIPHSGDGISKILSESELPDFIGKEVSQKIINGEGSEGKSALTKGFKVISGLDLKVGGEGMKGFYDQMLPSFVNKYTKKWGGKVGESTITAGEDIMNGEEGGSTQVHSLDITPSMREAIQSEGQPLFQDARGMIVLSPDKQKRVIYLFKNADQTTLIHEFSHMWFEDMFNFVQSGKADENYIKHYQTVKTWLGIEEGQSSLTTEQQEKFASGFERFLGDGQEPFGSNLTAAFQAFRQWMTQIYRNGNDTEINQDVRDFFSRMLGSKRAQTDKDFVMDESYINEVNADLDASIKIYGDVDDIKEDVSADIENMTDEDAQKVFTAEYASEQLAQIRSINKYLKGKISGEYIKDRLHKDYMKQMLWMMGKDVSMPDKWLSEFARLYPETGLSESGEKPTLQAFDEWLIDYSRSLGQRISGLKKQISEGRAVEKAFAYKKKGHVKHLAKALRKNSKLKAISDKVIASFKRGLAAGMREGRKAGMKEAREQYSKIVDQLRYEIKDRKRIKKEISDYAKAMLNKSQMDKAFALIKNAETQDALIKAFVRINEYREKAERAKAISELRELADQIASHQSIDVKMRAEAKDALRGVDLAFHSQSVIDRITRMREAIEKMKADGKDATVTQDMAKELAILEKQNIRQMTMSQISGYKAKLEQILEMARRKLKIRKEARELRKQVILMKLAEGTTAFSSEDEYKAYGRQLTAEERLGVVMAKLSNVIKDKSIAISPVSVIFDTLDGSGATYAGTNHRTFKGAIDLSFGRYLNMLDDLQTGFVSLAKELNLNQQNFERIAIYAMQAQEGGDLKLQTTLSPEQYKEFQNLELTSEEMTWYRKARETLDSTLPEVKRVMYEEFNQELDAVIGYFPFMTDFAAMSEAEMKDRFGSYIETVLEDGVQVRRKKNPEMSFTKERVGGRQKVKLNAFDIMMKHTSNVAYMITMTKDIRLLNEVAKSEEYAKIAGDMGQNFVLDWLDVMARKGGVTGEAQIEWLNNLRRNIGVGTLGFKLTSMLIQPSSLFDAAGRIGGDWVLKGVTHITTDRRWVELVMKMPEIRRRAGDDPAYAEFIAGQLNGDFVFMRKLQEAGMKPLQWLDMLSAMSTAAGAYEKHMTKMGKEIDFDNLDEAAAQLAQLDVQRTQSSAFFKDAPLMLTRGKLTGYKWLDKALGQFQSFVLTRFSTIHDIKAEARRGDAMAIANRAIWYIVASIAVTGMRAGIATIKDLIDDDDKENDLAKMFVNEALSNVPLVGNILSQIATKGQGSVPIPALSVAMDIPAGITSAVWGKKPDTRARGAIRAATGAARLAGVPGSAEAKDFLSRAVTPKKKINFRSRKKKALKKLK